jgi:hypothetical protein
MAYTTIDKPTDYFNTLLYTGTGSSNALTGVGFQPDWVWIKARGDTYAHRLVDSVRGVTKEIFSNTTDDEATDTNGLTAFGTDGFTLGSSAAVNESSGTYVAWNWLGANGTASNSDGSITSTVSANTTSGFSIVSYTGTGSNATVGHGLGVAPKVLILKSRTRSDGAWTLGSDMLGWTKFLFLNETSSEQTFNLYQNTSPTSSVFYLSGDGGVNQSGGSMIGYAFAEKKGYSKFGSYTGNGDADGTFVYTGFKPSWVLVKRTDGTQDWFIIDNKRNTFNLSDTALLPNASDADYTSANIYGKDMLSNGFKVRGSSSRQNGSGNNYIYMAFAENPFVNSNGVPTNAR